MWDKVEYNGLEADIFALGVLLYELVFNVIPFEQSNDDIYKDIRNKNNEKF